MSGLRKHAGLGRKSPKPKLSVVVVVHNIPREASRTLYSLSPHYQRHIAAQDYEVIVVDNGSTPPFDARYSRISATPSA